MGTNSSSNNSKSRHSTEGHRQPRLRRHIDLLNWRIRSLRTRMVKHHEESSKLRKATSGLITSNTPGCSEVDGQTLRNKLSSSERKLNSSDKRLSDHRDSLDVLILNFDQLNSDISEYSNWLKKNHSTVSRINSNVEDSVRLKENEAILKELKHRSNILTKLEKQGKSLTVEQGAHCQGINGIEKHILDQRVAEMREAESHLSKVCIEQSKCLRNRVDARRKLHVDVNTAQSWLGTARAGLTKYALGSDGQRLWPLNSDLSQQKLNEYLSMQVSIKEKNDQLLNMVDNSIVVIQDCGHEYKDMIMRKLEEIKKSTKELFDEINVICIFANNIVPKYIQFYSDMENMTTEIDKVKLMMKDKTNENTVNELEDSIKNKEIVEIDLKKIEKIFENLQTIAADFKINLSNADSVILKQMLSEKSDDIKKLRNISSNGCQLIYDDLLTNFYSFNNSIENQYADCNNSNKTPEIKLNICQEILNKIPSKIENISEIKDISSSVIGSPDELNVIRNDLISLQDKLLKRTNRLNIVVTRRDQFLTNLQQNFDELKMIKKDIEIPYELSLETSSVITRIDAVEMKNSKFLKIVKQSDDIINDEIASDDSILTSVNNVSAGNEQMNEMHSIQFDIKKKFDDTITKLNSEKLNREKFIDCETEISDWLKFTNKDVTDGSDSISQIDRIALCPLDDVTNNLSEVKNLLSREEKIECELDKITLLAENIGQGPINSDLRTLLTSKVRSLNDECMSNSSEISDAVKLLRKRDTEYNIYKEKLDNLLEALKKEKEIWNDDIFDLNNINNLKMSLEKTKMNLEHLHSLTSDYEEVQRVGLKLTVDSRINSVTISTKNDLLKEKWITINDTAMRYHQKLTETLENYTIYKEKFKHLEKLYIKIENKLPTQDLTTSSIEQLNKEFMDYKSIENLVLEYRQDMEKMSTAAIKLLSNIKSGETKEKIKSELVTCRDITEKIEFKLNYQLETVICEIQQRDEVTSVVTTALSYMDVINSKIIKSKNLGPKSTNVEREIQTLQLIQDEFNIYLLEMNLSLDKSLEVYIEQPHEIIGTIENLEKQKNSIYALMDTTNSELYIAMEARQKFESLCKSITNWIEDTNATLNRSSNKAVNKINNIIEEINEFSSKMYALEETKDMIALTTVKNDFKEISSEYQCIEEKWNQLRKQLDHRRDSDNDECSKYLQMLNDWLKKSQNFDLILSSSNESGIEPTDKSLEIAGQLICENDDHLKMYTNSLLFSTNSDINELHEQITNKRDSIIKQVTILKRIKTDWSEFNKQLENLKDGFVDMRNRYNISLKTNMIRNQFSQHTEFVNEIEEKKQKLNAILLNNEGNLWNVETPPNEAMQLKDSLEVMHRDSVTSINNLSLSINKLDNYESDIITLQSLINEAKMQYKDCKDLPEYAQKQTLVRSKNYLLEIVPREYRKAEILKVQDIPYTDYFLYDNYDDFVDIENSEWNQQERTSSRITDNSNTSYDQSPRMLSGHCTPLSNQQSFGSEFIAVSGKIFDSVDYSISSEDLEYNSYFKQNIPEIKVMEYNHELNFEEALKRAHQHVLTVCNNSKSQMNTVKACQDNLNEINMAEKCIIAAENTDDEVIEISDIEKENGLRDHLTNLSNQITQFRIQIQKNLVYATTESDNAKNLTMKLENLQIHVKEYVDKINIIENQEYNHLECQLLKDNINKSTIIQRSLNDKLREIGSLKIEISNSPLSNILMETLRVRLSEIHTLATSTRLRAITNIDCIRTEINSRKSDELNDSLIVEQNISEDDQLFMKILSEAKQMNIVDNSILEKQNQIVTKKLRNDLNEHNSLLNEVMVQADKVDSQVPNTVDLWCELAENSHRRVEHLKNILKNENTSCVYEYTTLSDKDTTAKRLSDLKTYVSTLNLECNKLQSEQDKDQLKSPEEFSDISQNAVQAFSDWLDSVESRVINSTMNFDNDDDINFHLITCEQLSEADEDIVLLTDSINTIGNSVAGVDEGEHIDKTIKSLLRRYRLLNGQAKHAADSLKVDNDNWLIKQEKIRFIQAKLCEQRQIMECVNDESKETLHDAKIAVQNAGISVSDIEKELDTLKLNTLERRRSSISYLNPSTLAPPIIGVDSLKQICSELKQKSIDQSNDLQLAITSEIQYEKMLNELTEFLNTAQARLNSDNFDCIECDSFAHLISMSKAHLNYFSDLESMQILLDVTSTLKIQPVTRHRYMAAHTRLANLTGVILDKAGSKSHLFTRAEYRWDEYNKLYDGLKTWFDALEPLIVENEKTDDQNEIWRLKTQLDRLTTKKSDFYEMADRGHRLLQVVNCESLQNQLEIFEQSWVLRFTDTKTSLKKYEMQLRHNEEFKMACTKLESIIKSMDNKVISLTKNKKGKTSDKKYSCQMLNLAKELESHRNLKSQVQSLSAFISDSAKSNETINKLNDKWSNLSRKLLYNENKYHADEMALQPSRQALFDLESWLHELEIDIKKDDQTVSASLVDAQVVLQKYRITMLDLKHRRQTIDFISRNSSTTYLDNKSREIVNMSTSTSTSKDGVALLDDNINNGSNITLSDHTNDIADADRLGTVIHLHQNLSRIVEARLNQFESLEEKWKIYENGLNNEFQWIEECSSKVDGYSELAHEISIKNARKDALVIVDELENHKNNIEKLKDIGYTIVQGAVDFSGKQAVDENQNRLTNEIVNLKTQLVNLNDRQLLVLELYKKYNDCQTSLNISIAECHHLLSNHRLLSGNVETFSILIKKIIEFKSEYENSESTLNNMKTIGDNLLKECPSLVNGHLPRSISDMLSRWLECKDSLITRIEEFNEAKQLWIEYESFVESLNADITSNELIINSKLYDSDLLKKNLSDIATRVSTLPSLSELLMCRMDSVTISRLTTLETNLASRRLKLQQRSEQEQRAIYICDTRLKEFFQLSSYLNTFLVKVEESLKEDDASQVPDQTISDANLELRINRLKIITVEFNENNQQFDRMIQLAYRIALDGNDSTMLKELQHKWKKMLTEATERCRMARTNQISRLSFNEKCCSWLKFISDIEHDLQAPLSGNYEVLQSQRSIFQLFHHRVYMRQENLFSIINEGNLMLINGFNELPKEMFKDNLKKLDKQWLILIERISQRKSLIDVQVSDWMRYHEAQSELRNILDIVESTVTMVIVNKRIGIQQAIKIRSVLKKTVDMAEKESFSDVILLLNSISNFETGKQHAMITGDTYKHYRSLSNTLMQRADSDCRIGIKKQLDVSSKRCKEIWNSLSNKIKRIDDILENCNYAEREISLLHSDHIQIRNKLELTLPNNYKELECLFSKIQDYESSYCDAKNKIDEIYKILDGLCKYVNADDIVLLKQRLIMIDKQWEQIQTLTEDYSLSIKRKMDRWKNFDNEHRRLIERYDSLELIIRTEYDSNIDDVLDRLENQYQSQYDELSLQRYTLITIGETLCKASTQCQCTNINLKLTSLEAKSKQVQSAIEGRVKKIKDTVSSLGQLQTTMSELRRWLNSVECLLRTAIVYHKFTDSEISKHLEQIETQQKDIDTHATAVTSVLSLCDLLLTDTDACSSVNELSCLREARESLQSRWHSIGSLIIERKISVENTMNDWKLFKNLHLEISDWLTDCESKIASLRVDGATISIIKKEVKIYEKLQNSVQENLSQLEKFSSFYRNLARKGQVDKDGKMRCHVTTCYSRWDEAWRCIYACSRRRRHLLAVSDDFDSAREGVLRWLADVNERLGASWRLTDELTNNETAAQCEIIELEDLKKELANSSQRMAYIEKAGNYLIQRCEPSDSVIVQQHLDEFTFIRDQIVTKIKRCLEKLTVLDQQKRSAPTKLLTTSSQSSTKNISSTTKEITDKSTKRNQLSNEKELSTIKLALEKATKQITEAESLLRCSTPIGPETNDLPTDYYEVSVCKCKQIIDELKDLENKAKFTKKQKSVIGVDNRIKSLLKRWQSVLERALQKDERLKIHYEQWVTLKKDLKRLTTWLDEVELESHNVTQPSSLRDIEIATRSHIDFKGEILNWKSIIHSMNIMKNELKDSSKIGKKLNSKLTDINRRWDRLNASTSCRSLELGVCLMHSNDFAETLRELIAWLDSTQMRVDSLQPVDFTNGERMLVSIHAQFKDVRNDLDRSHSQIEVLREMSELLLTDPKVEAAANSRDKLNIITNRYNDLRQICQSNMMRIESLYPLCISTVPQYYKTIPLLCGLQTNLSRWAMKPLRYFWNSSDGGNKTTDLINKSKKKRRRCSWLWLILLILLLLAGLLMYLMWPQCDDDIWSNKCNRMNSLRNSFNIMLTHTDGPPPS